MASTQAALGSAAAAAAPPPPADGRDRPRRAVKPPETFKAEPAPPPAVAHALARERDASAGGAAAAAAPPLPPRPQQQPRPQPPPAAAEEAPRQPRTRAPPETFAAGPAPPPSVAHREARLAAAADADDVADEAADDDDDDDDDVAAAMEADDGEDADEFRPAGDSDDDEATLEEEERAAAAEGGGTAEEMDALLAEADMPVEELMRRYYGAGAAASPPAAPPAPAAASRPAAAAPVPAPADGDGEAELPPGFARARPAAAAAAAAPAPAAPARPVPARLVLPPPPPPLSPRSDALRGARCAAAREREDALLLRARHLREEASRRAAEPPVPAAKPEPARNKTHWDHLLEEMAWLARDSDRERKWKRKQARKAATAVKGSRLDIESRAAAREAAEAATLRRIASTCAREVRLFWGKAEKLVRIKANMALEAQRKSAMDKHLEFVMAQTERYCNLVATKLTAAPAAGTAGAGPSQPRRALPAAAADDDDAFEPDSDGMDEDDEATLEEQMEAEEAEGGAAAAAAEAAALAAEQDAPLEDLLPPELLARYRAGGAATPSDASEEEEEEEEDADDAGDADADAPALRELARSPPRGTGAAAAADDDPSSSFEGGSEEDDEATLEEEERAAAAEGGAEDAREAEMEALRAEADLPLDEILRRMGYNPAAADADDDDGDADGGDEGDGDGEASSGEEGVDDEDGDGDGDDSGGEEGEEAAGRWAQALLASPPAKGGAAGDDDAEAGRRGLEQFAASAGVAQPTGHTLATTSVSTRVPFLMKAQLREYQHVGLDWLVALYEKQLNGILADEMGLGKTIQTISLLAHLACERGIWGPHLIVVPTSVMLNWETEFKRFCPAFKLLTYFGSAKERKAKRAGWSKPNAFHVCITTYRLITQDAKVFRRKKWRYLILDEAHMIKNWRSQRWQTLLNFQAKRRLLLTGTPLQNDLMELWSLMHFLMPHVFQSHAEFKSWFSNPLTGMVENGEAVNRELVSRLHGVLRPFLLRRLKADVEKTLPAKVEHVVRCRLSKRQRRLYEEYIGSGDTQGTLASGNLLGIMNCLMQLRKVCNHPDLFAGRPIISAYDCERIEPQLPSLVLGLAEAGTPAALAERLGTSRPGLLLAPRGAQPAWAAKETHRLQPSAATVAEAASAVPRVSRRVHRQRSAEAEAEVSLFAAAAAAAAAVWRRERVTALAELSARRAAAALAAAASPTVLLASPAAGAALRARLAAPRPLDAVVALSADPRRFLDFSSALRAAVHTPAERAAACEPLIETFVFAIPKARAAAPAPWCSAPTPRATAIAATQRRELITTILPAMAPLHPALVRRQVFFPDRRLIQFDCGKLQELAVLLRGLKAGGHKALIFTQMTRMLDVLESFLNLYGYTYCRLDGSTRPEQRQIMMQRFNTDPRIFCFILSTRSGGFGINLVGADTVIFYDSDWNPAMDAQAQDRAHRIGQTREVHIYRLVCASTIEENILKKATQKRQLDWMAIQSGGFNTDFFTQQAAGGAAGGGGGGAIDPRDFFEGMPGFAAKPRAPGAPRGGEASAAELAAAMRDAEDDADAAATAAAERETAADVAEMNEEIRPADDASDDDEAGGAAAAKDGADAAAAPAKPTAAAAAAAEAAAAEAAAAAAAAAEEDEMLADVAKVTAAASRAGGSIEDALSPVERYALRWAEANMPPLVTPEAAAAVEFEEKQWELGQLEKAKAAAEAAADDDADGLAVEDWDASAATAAYQRAAADAARRAEEEAAAAAVRAAEEAAARARAAARHAAAKQAAAAAAAAAAQAGAPGPAAPPKPRVKSAGDLAGLGGAGEPRLTLKVKLADAAAAPAWPEGFAPADAGADLGTSRAGRKRKAPQLPGAEDELIMLPRTGSAKRIAAADAGAAAQPPPVRTEGLEPLRMAELPPGFVQPPPPAAAV